jgi:hypothetical protein
VHHGYSCADDSSRGAFAFGPRSLTAPEVATVIDRLIPPHPAHGLSCGRGAEAMVLAILDGHHALSKVGKRLEERGMVALLQPGLTRAALRGYPETFSLHRRKIMQHPCGNETQGDRNEQVDSA